MILPWHKAPPAMPTRAELLDLLCALPPSARAVLVLQHAGWHYGEIERLLDLVDGDAAAWMVQGREALQAAWDAREGTM